MEQALVELFSVANLIFALVVSFVVWVQRACIEKIWPTYKSKKLWNDLFLPFMPIITGGVMAGLISSYPYPESFSGFWPRVFLGSVLGMASGHLYRVIKKFLIQKESEYSGKKETE